jgi:hypothetical protein
MEEVVYEIRDMLQKLISDGPDLIDIKLLDKPLTLCRDYIREWEDEESEYQDDDF